MAKIGQFAVYFGTPKWGWTMYGVGWGTLWFFGYSKRRD